MNEWFLLAYPVVLFAYLMLAAHWQPRGSPTKANDRAPDRRKGRTLSL